MNDNVREWLKQADYDMKSAEAMYTTKRYLHVVFMCHLSIEKALKGLVERRTGGTPPRTHSLMQLLRMTGTAPPERVHRLLLRLSEVSVPTRYPENIERIRREYTARVAKEIISQGKEVLAWIRAQR